MSSVQSNPYRLVALCLRYEEANVRLMRYTIHHGKITSETSIALLLGRYWYTRRNALSPNREWLYCLFHAESALIHLKERRWYGPKKVPLLNRDMYDFRWSPNSRFLAGVPAGEISCRTELVLLSVPDFRWCVLVRCHPGSYIFNFGWYPDSRRLWYTLSPVPAVSSDLKWYQISRTGLRRQLPPSEQQKIEQGWGMMISACCLGGGMPYTADLSLRVNYEMFKWRLAWIERRDKRIFRLTPPHGEEMMPAPLDISADKEWFLGVYGRGSIFVAHIPTNRWERVFVLPDKHDLVWAGFEQSASLLI